LAAIVVPILSPSSAGAAGATVEVTLPDQLTDNSYYERGQSIAYDGSDYWMFYGRSTTVTGPYSSSNPDVNDYEAYYKKASGVAGLASATAQKVTGTHNTNGYLGETGAVYFGSDVWGFMTVDVGTTADLYGWWTSDGGTTWTEVGPIITGLSDGQAHHDEIVFDSKVWVVEGSGNFTTIHSSTPKTGGWSSALTVGSATGGLAHFFIDSSKLYLAISASGTNYIYEYDDTVPEWDLVDSVAASGHYDPTLFKVGSDFVFAQAPYVSPRQYIVQWHSDTLDSDFFNGTSSYITSGQYGSNEWVDMWPIGYTDASGNDYLLYTSERDTPSAEGVGNIWLLEVDWDLDNDHFTWIQEGIDGASAGDTVSVAAGTYEEQLTIDKGLTVDGAGTGSTSLDMTTAPLITVSANDATIKNMTLTDGTYLTEAIRVTSSSGLTVNSVEFENLGIASGNAYGIHIQGSFTDLEVTSSSFTGMPAGSYERAIAVYVPKEKTVSDFSFADTDFIRLFVGIYISSEVDGLTVTGSTFGPMDLQDCHAAAAGVYIGDGKNSFDITDVDIDGNTFTNYCRGVYMWDYVDGDSIETVDITDNSFNESIWSSAIRLMARDEFNFAFIEGPLTVSGNTFTQTADVGAAIASVDLRYGGESTTSQVTITDNSFTFGSGISDAMHAIKLRGAATNVDILRNTMNGGGSTGATGGPPSISGLNIDPNSMWGPMTANLDVAFENNVLTGFVDGVSIYDSTAIAYGGLPTGATVKLFDNSITSHSGYGVHGGTGETVDASGNWWGIATPAGVAAEVSGAVDYTPWLGSGTDTSTDAGFQGDFSVLWVDDDSTQTGSTGRVQEGVDLVTASTVHLAAGTYEEQVEIAKTVTLVGQGPTSVIKSPATLTKKFTTSNDNYPIVYIHDATGVTLQDLKVDGAGRGNSNYRFVGIAFRNAGGTVDTVTVQDVRDTPFSGAQHGVGIYAMNDDTTSRSVSVLDCTVTGFQKTAIALNASSDTPLVVDVDGSIVTGAGATTVTAQNGIQVWADQGTGTIDGNTVSGIAYDNTSDTTKWAATSILNYFADLDVKNNTISGAHLGIYYYDGGGQVTNNSLSIEKVGVYAYGVIGSDPQDAVPWPFDYTPLGGGALLSSGNFINNTRGPDQLLATVTVNISDNTVAFSGTDNSSTYGIDVEAGWDNNDLDATIDNNDVSGFESGIEVIMCDSGCGTGVFSSVSATGNCLYDNDYGVRSNDSTITVDAEGNWWGDDSGPYHPTLNPTGTGDEVSDYVDFDPWVTGGCGSSTVTGNWKNLSTGVFDDLQDSIDDASYGDTIQAVGGEPLAGGATASTSGVIVDLNGKTAGPGSPFLTVTAADVTVLGPGTLDGNGSTDPAILVQSGGDNFRLEDVEVTDWYDGVEVASSVTSFKVVSNWIHTNGAAGLQINSGVTFGGIVTVEGNLFKENSGNGVQNDSGVTFDATYNSWGHLSGPTSGDGVSSNVTYDPWTFAEPYLDMEPDTDATQVSVSEGTTFNVKLKADAAKLYGISFTIKWDTTNLTYNGITFSTTWASRCTALSGLAADEIGYRCNLLAFPSPGDPEWDATGGDVATLSFTAQTGLSGNGPWESFFDIYSDAADTSAGAKGGVKVFVNNAGYNTPGPRGDITDTDDGKVTIIGKANYAGFIDLQGRADDSGAVLEVYDVATSSSATKLATATSLSSGSYQTAHIAPHELLVGTTYYLYFDRDLFVPTSPTPLSAPPPPPPATYLHSKLLSTRPLTTLQTFVLRGGDAYNDNFIDVSDASCIGSDYGSMTSTCAGTGSNSDVNEDGIVDILDLTLMGGNYNIGQSTWTP